MTSIVIVHGWSDKGSSFRRLATRLSIEFAPPATVISISDWISLQDDVTYADIAAAMDRAWATLKLPTASRSVNIITHSTGALIVREWMTRYYTPSTVPIHRLVMLAPANFGSPLAHQGRSLIGRVLKGWGDYLGQTGTQLLKGLELGSPYTLELAKKDLFAVEAWYGEGKILATVLVGNSGYEGVAAIANEDGGDGTVRISTANINASLLQLTLDENQQIKDWKHKKTNGTIAFGIIDKENHTTITLSERPSNTATLRLIVDALKVSDNDYRLTNGTFTWQAQINATQPLGLENSPRYMNLVTKVSDHLGNIVDDYFIQIYRKTGEDNNFETKLYEDVFDKGHAYEDDKSFRSIYISIDELYKLCAENVNHIILSISAHPVFSPPRQPVGYASVDIDTEDGLKIEKIDIPKFFVAHETMITEIVLHRQIDDKIFRIKNRENPHTKQS